MSVHRSIAGGAGQVLSIAIRNVLTGLGVTETLGQAKVDYVDVVLLLADTDKEVIWLNVSVQEVARVHKLDPLKLKSIIRKVENILPSDRRA